MDQLLGLVVEGALIARDYAASLEGGEKPPPSQLAASGVTAVAALAAVPAMAGGGSTNGRRNRGGVNCVNAGAAGIVTGPSCTVLNDAPNVPA